MEKYILGVDEAGRGALAGKIFVGAVLLPKKSKNIFKNAPYSIPKDSKKLTKFQREQWFNWIKKNKIKYSYSYSSNKIIDRVNINKATEISVKRAIMKLKLEKDVINSTKLISDKGFSMHNDIKKTFSYSKILHADNFIYAVSLASIVAKVARDNYMIKISKKYPEYCFYKNKGYGTKFHINVIKKYGPSEIHRLTFIKKYNKLRIN